MEKRNYLVPSDEPARKAADYSSLCEPNIYDSLTVCMESTAGQGLETLMLDLTREDIGLPVVRVIVPGLRHFWRRTAPGRLYQVPAELNWLESPLSEEQLNPVSLFI